MNSIHFIPFHRCVLVHSVLFTPFSTNPSPYEPVMWGFNPYFLGASQNMSEQSEGGIQVYIALCLAIVPKLCVQIVAIELGYMTFPFPFSSIHMSVNCNMELIHNISVTLQPTVKYDKHLSNRVCSLLHIY